MALATYARRLMRKEYQGFLCSISLYADEYVKFWIFPLFGIVQRSFPDDSPGIPIDREIEFNIEVVLGTRLILKVPYRMASTELRS